MLAQSETPAGYAILHVPSCKELEDSCIQQALGILVSRMPPSTDIFIAPQTVRDFLRLKLGGLPHETFVVMFLNAQHGLIAYEEMFRGTLTQTSVYPREVVKASLRHNAAAVILAHNHPSGLAEPSRSDELLTQTLKSSLALVDVRVLDHFVVTAGGVLSFAEKGLL